MTDVMEKSNDADADDNDNEFIPKNILLTGGAGFIGSHVTRHLVCKYPDCNVIVLDKLDVCSSLENLEMIKDKPNYKFVQGNICSSSLVSYILKRENIDTIFHFAAQTHVDNSFGNSLEFTESNIVGTHVLLEAAKACGIQRFVHVSTDEVYGETSHNNFCSEEKSLLQPTNPYAATKAGAEFLVQAYHKAFNLPTIITRANNIYGPNQYPEKVIPKFICLLKRGRLCTIHGNGKQERNYLFVSDAVEAYDIILRHGKVGNVFNIGTEFCLSTVDVAGSIIDVMFFDTCDENLLCKKKKELISFVEDRAFNDLRYQINSEKMEKLGWKPKISWKEGLTRTVHWYLDEKNSNRWNNINIENALLPHPVIKSNTFYSL